MRTALEARESGQADAPPRLALVERVHLQHTEGPLHDLHARPHVGCLQRHVREPVDGDPGLDLDEQRSLLLDGQIALAHGGQEGRQLGLQHVQIHISAQGDRTLLCHEVGSEGR